MHTLVYTHTHTHTHILLSSYICSKLLLNMEVADRERGVSHQGGLQSGAPLYHNFSRHSSASHHLRSANGIRVGALHDVQGVFKVALLQHHPSQRQVLLILHAWPPHPDVAAQHDEKKEDKQNKQSTFHPAPRSAISLLHNITDNTDLKRKKINNKLSILLQNRPPHSYTAEQNEGWNWFEMEEDKQQTFYPPPESAAPLLHCWTEWRMKLIWNGRR